MDIDLRPPLPPHLAHEGIQFVMARSAQLSNETVAAIGAALQALLPHGDISILPSGEMELSSGEAGSDARSLWRTAGRLEGVERNNL